MSAAKGPFDFEHVGYRHLVTRFDPDPGIFWSFMNPEPRPCFNPDLLADIRASQRVIDLAVRHALDRGKPSPIRYGVLASLCPGVYSLGGDLDLFRKYITAGDREGLRRYALSCVEPVHQFSINLGLPMTTISLVQGEALGGGFEGALCCSVIVAEEGARFGLPEILFNLFPGMGAYSFLSRRLDAARAEQMITSGQVYTAAELHAMGVVDVLARDGEGEKAVYDFVRARSRRGNAHQAIMSVRHRVHPVPLEELVDVAEIWVDAALGLAPKDLRMMDRLVRAQDRVAGAPSVVREGQAEYA